jgi:hypothetical protein
VRLDLLVIAVGIALEPIPLTTFILILTSMRGVRKGAAFIFGWLVSLAIVVAVTVLATGNTPPSSHSSTSTAALVVKLVIGLVLIGIAERRRRRMGKPKKPKKTPKWQTGIDQMSMWFAFALAPLTQPWGLIAAGVTVIVQAHVGSAESIIALLLFCIVASSTYIALEVYAGFWPEQAQVLVTRIRAWIDAHTDQAIIVLSLGLGLFLVASSAYYLFT